MYMIVYRPDLNKPETQTKQFESYKSLLYFANKFQADGYVLEIKWIPNNK